MTWEQKRGLRRTKRCGNVHMNQKKLNVDVHTCIEPRFHDGLHTDGNITWETKDEG